ncbi:NUDIX domain-containing protein [[Bacillus] enclensis]|uniref:NUDIX domain-containing protein n=1 Tax=[Bacillus] enclensis TaxID=1402860 RepID=UPI000509486D|nr:NUDIX hydrolase [[Bacillus] enclensis]MBH9964787.1 NUDIX hydrolase [[Bacillus] enclensis]QWC21227.1 NUDIX hydrolase [Bacillus haikouensis]
MNKLKNNGYEFMDFLRIKEEEMSTYRPLAGSFAVVKCGEKVLMCYNVWRKQWELPAGRREGDETPKECAARELYEETGQVAEDLEFIGLLKSKNIITGGIKYNPVYFKAVEELQPFIKNEETSEIRLWDSKEEIGELDMVDVKVLEFV